MKIVLLNAATLPIYREELTTLFNDALAHGAELALHPTPLREADEYYHWLREAMCTHQQLLWIARDGHGVIGSVQLTLAHDQQRGTVSALVVNSTAQRQGVARQLMRELENMAFSLRRGVLSLDIEAGTPVEAFCRAQGYLCSTQSSVTHRSPRYRGRVYYKQLIPNSPLPNSLMNR